MDPANLQQQQEPEEPRLLNFPKNETNEQGEPILNKWSSVLTRGHGE